MEFQQRKMKFLVIGDFHIPERAEDIPKWILDITEEDCKKEKFDAVLCTGDLTDRVVIRKLEEFGPVKCVRGNMDHLQMPETHLIKAGSFSILLLHGTGIHPRGDIRQLDKIRKNEGADIVIHGHTHKMGFEKTEGKPGGPALFINPGTATGSWGGSSGAAAQTFVIMEIKNDGIFIRFFENGKLKQEVETCIRKRL